MPFKLLKASSENERIYGFYFTVKYKYVEKRSGLRKGRQSGRH